MKDHLKPLKWMSILLLAAWCYLPASAQAIYAKADSIAAAFDEPYENVEDLALKLTQGLSSDAEKARVLFMWIAHHIRYDVGEIRSPSKPPQFQAQTKEALKAKIEAWQRESTEKTLKYRKGVCEHYSRLYKALCDAAGLEAVLIGGNARDFYRPGRNALGESHAWNAVKIDGEWRLLDATWGAGYVKDGTKFYRSIAPGFFFTSPELFAQNHFPDDERWQLLQKPLSKKEFSDQPLINYGQTEYRILDFAPRVEISEGGNKKEIWLVFETVPQELLVTNKRGKPLAFQRTDTDGKVVLSFSGSTSGGISIFGGRSLRSRLDWMAEYE
jgi:hypothetical protein